MRHVLDTSILISHWRHCLKGKTLAQINEKEAESWGQRLIEIERSDAIVTPVSIEFLCGVRDRREINLARAFLKPFKTIDDRRTLKRDWQEALRLAARVPASQRPRDLGDCLIRAIARRLNHEVRSFDTGMPRS